MRRIADLVRRDAEPLARLVVREQGKPISEARGEVGGAATFFDYFAEQQRAMLHPDYSDAEIRLDNERLRPSDVPALVGNPGKLKTATGWEPAVSLERSLRDLLQDWRERVAASASDQRPGPM